MAFPMIAAGIAARAVAKKLASRTAGGITGAGAKQVNPVYREMGTGSVKVVPQSGASRAQSLKDTMKYDIPKEKIKNFPIKINSNPTRAK